MPVPCLKTGSQFRTADPQRAAEGFGQAFHRVLLDSAHAEYGSHSLDDGPTIELDRFGNARCLANPFQISQPRVQAPLHLAPSVSARVTGGQRDRRLRMASASVRGQRPSTRISRGGSCSGSRPSAARRRRRRARISSARFCHSSSSRGAKLSSNLRTRLVIALIASAAPAAPPVRAPLRAPRCLRARPL